MKRFEDSVSYDTVLGQYKVSLPWKDNKEDLPSNFGLALGRLRGLQRSFEKNPVFCSQYTQVIKEQEKRGFIELVPKETNHQDIHYLSHHGVKKESNTTPIRVVYDCSAKVS